MSIILLDDRRGYALDVVVNVVVRHWVSVMVEGVEDQDKRGQEVSHQNEIFYADDGMVALSDPGWLQGTFSTLVGLFDTVGLRTNVRKKFDIVCRPCQVGDPVVGGVKSTDDRRGPFLIGAVEVMGAV